MITVTWKEKSFKDEYSKEFYTKKEADEFIKSLEKRHYKYEVTGEEESKLKLPPRVQIKQILAGYRKTHPRNKK